MVFLAQFRINLHEWVLRKAEIAPAASANEISTLRKTHKYKLIPNWVRKTVWVLINNINIKKLAWRRRFKFFWSHFSKLPHKIFVIFLRDIISLKKPIVFQPVIIKNYDVKFAVAFFLFASVLHLNFSALSQSESNIFSCILSTY